MKKACPICKKLRSEDHAPFCSQRCRDRDLARWFNDGYSVPGRPASEDELTRGDDGEGGDRA